MTPSRGQRFFASLLLVQVGSLAACGSPLAPVEPSVARMDVFALAPDIVSQLRVEATGPGIQASVLLNIPVGEDNIARGTLIVPAGSARRIAVTAFDTLGVAAFAGDTTIALVAGENPPLSLVLLPVARAP